MKRRLRDRVVLDASAPNASQDRVERRVFEELERSPIVSSPPESRPFRAFLLGAGLVTSLAAAVFAISRNVEDELEPTQLAVSSKSSTIVTGNSEGARITLGETVVDVGRDTKVAVGHSEDGGALLDLDRGSVDCDVTPRAGRPAFRVRAGDVTVNVLGTRFTVSKVSNQVRVEVLRGKVSVSKGAEKTVLEPGAVWSSAGTKRDDHRARGESETLEKPPVGDVIPNTGEAQKKATNHTRSSGEPATPLTREAKFEEAQRLERFAPTEAVRMYQELAGGRDAWAALALYSLADRAVRNRRMAEAHDLARQYERRFPGGANAEEIAWLQVQIAAPGESANEASRRYLKRYPSGAYAARARGILERGTTTP